MTEQRRQVVRFVLVNRQSFQDIIVFQRIFFPFFCFFSGILLISI